MYLSSDTVYSEDDVLLADWPHYGPLLANDSVEFETWLYLPDTTAGIYYLLIVADKGKVHNDSNWDNNIALVRNGQNQPQAIEITLSPPVDLTLNELSISSDGISGQPLAISWSTVNNGPGTTGGKSWSEKIYLSSDFKLDKTDKLIGQYKVNDTLNSGSSYSGQIEANIPISVYGNYVILFVVDAGNRIYEHQAEDNNVFTKVVTIVRPLPSDLTVTRVTAPDSAMVGDQIEITWKIRNIGENPATGRMKNQFYLSSDEILDKDDIYLGEQTNNINLSSDAETELSAQVKTPGVVFGNYFMLVYTDAGNNIYESDELNNTTASENCLIDMMELYLSVPITTELSDNSALYYKLQIPDSLQGESLLTSLTSNLASSASNELYFGFEHVPSRTESDYKHSDPHAGNQDVLVPSVNSGTYYLMAYGNATNTSVQDVELLARKLNFEITSVETNKGGNTGRVTVKIEGSKFGGVRIAKLVGDDQQTISAARMYYMHSCLMYATFDLNGKETGIYDFILEKYSGEQAVLSDGFEIEKGRNPSVNVFVEHPEYARINRVVAMTVNYTNDGNVDIAIPVRYVISRDGAWIAETPEELEYRQTSRKVKLNEQGTPLTVLRPGASGKIILYTQPKRIEKLRFILTK